MTVEQILREVAQMPLQTRAFIAEKILEMLDADEQIELSDEWKLLIEKRAAEIDADQVEMLEAQVVIKEIWSDLK
ncbi:MAG: addiction module protein [Chloroflexota bacterium]